MLTEEDFNERHSCIESKADMSKHANKAKLRSMFIMYNADLSIA
jgi:hypothetical protein